MTEKPPRDSIARRFDADVEAFGGYVYTGDRLSCRLANQRMTDAIREAADLVGARVIDVGCGDGTYTMDLIDAGARSVLGIDAAGGAIARARERAAGRANVRFETADIHRLAPSAETFDVAILRGVLHHLDDPQTVVRAVCSLAPSIVVVEPNGYSPILKAIEKLSAYHREHGERSYAPRVLDRWFEEAWGTVARRRYVGLVPMFCPDAMARLCKRLEPLFERSTVLSRLCCAQYVQTIRVTASSVAR